MKSWLICLLLWLSQSAWALEQPTFQNPVDEKRYHALIQETRCPTCQNSNIAESNAPLARQLREQIAELITAGQSDGEIVAYLVERYGDFIHYNPPVNIKTLLLWYAPLLLMTLGVWWLVQHRRAPRQYLNAAEYAELRTWLQTYGAEDLLDKEEGA